MNRLLLLCILALAALFLFVSCENDDDDHSAGDDDDDDDDNDDNDDTPSFEIPLHRPQVMYDDGKLMIERIAGGLPGKNGVNTAQLADGTLLVAAEKGRTAMLYSLSPDGVVVSEAIAHFAARPLVAVGPNDSIHYLYHDIRKELIVYATKVDNEWIYKTIENLFFQYYEEVDRFALTVDKNNFVYFAYISHFGKKLMLETNAGGKWVVEEIAECERYYPNMSNLEIDDNGTLHLLAEINEDVIYYVSGTPGSWTQKAVLSGDSAYYDLSLALNGDDQPVLAAITHKFETNAVKIGERIDDVWTFSAIKESSDTYYNIDLRFDAAGNPAIAYTYQSAAKAKNTLGLLRRNGSQWTAEDVGDYNENPAFALQFGGEKAVIACADKDNGLLSVFAEREAGWSNYELDLAPEASSTGIAFDSAGRTWIGFSGTQGTAGRTTGWLGFYGDRGWSFIELPYDDAPSLMLDEQDRPHIAVWNPHTKKLLYGLYEDNQWTFTPIVLPVTEYDGHSLNYRDHLIKTDRFGVPYIAAAGYYKVDIIYNYAPILLTIANAEGNWIGEDVGLITAGHVFFDLIFPIDNSPLMFAYNYSRNLNGAESEYLLNFYFDQGIWDYEFITSQPLTSLQGFGCDAVIDDHNNIMISHSADLRYNLRLAVGNESDWQHFGLAEGRHQMYTAITLDNMQNPLIAYSNDASSHFSEIRIVSPQQLPAEPTDIDSQLENLRQLEMEIDNDGIVHVLYDANAAVYHARFPKEMLSR